MDKKQLLLRLSKTTTYTNFKIYEHKLKAAAEVIIDFTNMTNQEILSKSYDEVIKTQTIDSKFDNVFFNIRGMALPHFLTGEIEVQNCGLHIQPIKYETKKNTVYTLLVTDYRMYGKAVMCKSFLLFADMSGLHVMPQTDSQAARHGCVCYAKNPFNNHQPYGLQIRERMPCMANDAGFALPECRTTGSACESVVSYNQSIAKLVKTVLAFINLPSNYILRVDHYRKSKSGHKKVKSKKPYYIVVDEEQIRKIINGDKQAEFKGNSFVDGSMFNIFMTKERLKLGVEEFDVGDVHYTVLSI